MIETRSKAAAIASASSNADESALCVDLSNPTTKTKLARNHASKRGEEAAAGEATSVVDGTRWSRLNGSVYLMEVNEGDVASVSSGASNKRKRARARDAKIHCHSHTQVPNREAPTLTPEPGTAIKRARVDPGAPQRSAEEAADSRVSSDSRAARNAKILLEASSRLVWSRLEEVEGLKASLVDLGHAIHQVEAMRQRIEASVDRDLQSATQVAAVYMPRVPRSEYGEPFAKFFYALIGHLIPN